MRLHLLHIGWNVFIHSWNLKEVIFLIIYYFELVLNDLVKYVVLLMFIVNILRSDLNVITLQIVFLEFKPTIPNSELSLVFIHVL